MLLVIPREGAGRLAIWVLLVASKWMAISPLALVINCGKIDESVKRSFALPEISSHSLTLPLASAVTLVLALSHRAIFNGQPATETEEGDMAKPKVEFTF